MPDFEIDVYGAGESEPQAISWISCDDDRLAVAFLDKTAGRYSAKARLELVDARGQVVKSCHGTAA